MDKPNRQVKLEIGSGGNPQPGYIHLDCRTGLPHLDIVGDIKRFLPLREATVDEILSHSSIEHVSWRNVRETLADWYRVLKPGGRAIIYTPDFRYLCRMYLEGKTDPHLDNSYVELANRLFGAYTPSVWAMIKMFAGQEYPENFHYACYDFDLLKSILTSVGFAEVTRIPPEYSLRVVAFKPVDAPISTPPKKVFPAAVLQQPTRNSSVTFKATGKPLININLVDRGWILERMGRELAQRLDYVSMGDGPDGSVPVNYHINYHAFKRKSGIDIALFTHIEENVPVVKDLFFDVARNVDYCVCMSRKYELILRNAGIQRVTTIMPGVELDCFQPILRIGVAGRTYHTGRKGEALVAKAMAIPHTAWYFAGDGWPAGGVSFSYDKLSEFYQVIDCLLVPALYEGGPMPALEALAAGKPVLSPPVGFVPEFPHIEYEAGNFDDLREKIGSLVEEKLFLRRSVEKRSWKTWAIEHHRLFCTILPELTDKNIIRETGDCRDAKPVRISSIPSQMTHETSVRSCGLKILLVARNEQLTGGPAIRIPILQELLRKKGHTVDVSFDPTPDPTGYDVAHVFNVWIPTQAISQLRHLKKFAVPVVLSPIFLDLSEMTWAARAQKLIFAPAVDAAAREKYLDALANGSLMLDNRSRAQGMEIFPGSNALLREIISLADHLVCLTIEEMQRIAKCLGVLNKPYSLVRNAADYGVFGNASPDLFMSTYGIKNFVLCVGRIEARKNQAMLLYGLRKSNIPIIFVGQNGEPDYEQLCRALAPPGTLFINQLDRREIASAYAAAKVCVQPSWAEGASLSNIEAAAASCPLVVSNRSSEFEYFGDGVRYCDPADWRSIAAAVKETFGSFDAEKNKREMLRNRLMATCTWEGAAEATLLAYESAIGEYKH